MRQVRVTFVGQTYFPDTTSTSQLFTELLEQLVEKHPHLRVTVLCGHPTGKIVAGTKVPRHESIRGIEVRRCGMAIDTKRSLLHRFFSYATYLGELFFRLVGQRHDIVFGITNPPFNAILIWMASFFSRMRFQYMLLDAYPEGLVALGNLKATSWTARFWLWLNRRAYRSAESIIVLGRDMTPILERNYGLPNDRMIYLPHWSAVKNQEVKRFEDSQLCQKLKLQDKFIVQYSGNMGLWHDMLTFVRAADVLRDRRDIHFLFIGGGIRRQEAEQLSKQLQLPNLTWHEFVPLRELEDSLACCHVALISLNQGLEGVAVPCKLYGILASGRAVLAQAPANSEVAFAVTESGSGLVVTPGDLQGLVNAIQELADDRPRVAQMGTCARKAFVDHYTLTSAIEKFEGLWSLTDRSTPR